MDGGAAYRVEQRQQTAAEECAFILETGQPCGAAVAQGSAYCERHHALCRLPGGSARERRRLGEAEALAAALGGRLPRLRRLPTDPSLRRIENIARAFFRTDRSRIVHGGDR